MFAHLKEEIEMEGKTLFNLLVSLVVVMVLLGGVLVARRVWAQDARVSRPVRELALEEGDQLATASSTSFDVTQLTSSVNQEEQAVVAVDDAGNVHVAFLSSYSEIYYKTYANGVWSGDTLVTGALAGSEPSIAVDSSGYAHIAFQVVDSVNSDSDIYYATNTSGSFLYTLLTPSGTANEAAPSIAVDGDQKVHIAYTTDAGGDSEVAYLTNVGGWGSAPVTNNTQDDLYPSIAVDVAGTVHIAYERFGAVDSQVYYASNEGGWSNELVPSGVTSAGGAAIAVDADRQPHIAFLGQMPVGHAAFHATKSGGSWAVSRATQFDARGAPTIALDAFGKAHLACVESSGTDAAVHHMTNFSGSWSDTSATSVPAQHDLSSTDRALALDRAGFVHVVYNDQDISGFAKDIYYARSTQPLGSRWHIETVDAAGDVGSDTSLVLDPDDHPHISYFDVTNGSLKYATWDGAAWQDTTVDTGGVGLFTSIDWIWDPQISYYDANHNALRLAYYSLGSWYTETVDSAGGMYTSLKVYPNTKISYYDPISGDLKYAYWDGQLLSWVTQTLVSGAGQYTSLALDSNYSPYIAYCDWTDGGVHMAWFDGASWYTETMYAGTTDANSASLALGENDKVYLSYNDHFDYLGTDYGAAYLTTQESRGAAKYHIPLLTLTSGRGGSLDSIPWLWMAPVIPTLVIRTR